MTQVPHARADYMYILPYGWLLYAHIRHAGEHKRHSNALKAQTQPIDSTPTQTNKVNVTVNK